MRADELFSQLIRSSICMKKYSNKVLSKIGITHGQAQILGFLADNCNKKITQKDIENEFGLSHATVNGFMKRMEEKGLLTTSKDEKDKRYKVVKPTNALKNYYEDAKAQSKDFINVLNSAMPESEQQMLFELLAKFERIGKSYVDDVFLCEQGKAVQK